MDRRPAAFALVLGLAIPGCGGDAQDIATASADGGVAESGTQPSDVLGQSGGSTGQTAPTMGAAGAIGSGGAAGGPSGAKPGGPTGGATGGTSGAGGKSGANTGGAAAGGAAGPPGAAGSSGASLGDRNNLGKCMVFPADNEWNRDISAEPVDPRSAMYMASMNAAGTKLHPDFGSNPAYGIPWITVPATQPKVPMSFRYKDESDPGPYPFPFDAPIEGGADSKGDRHVLVIDRDKCFLYEGFNCFPQPAMNPTGWRCDSGAVWNMRENKSRPAGWTSADAAGLAVFPGLVRLDEAKSGPIRHAFRFTASRTQRGYVFPATHQAGAADDPNLPPMGLRIRLKANYDLSRLSGAARSIAEAMKKYGMILADNGSNFYVSGESNPGWAESDLNQIKSIPASEFEAIRHSEIKR